MSREAQAAGRDARPAIRSLLPPFFVLAAGLFLASCAARGVDMEAAVDDITTASVPAAPATTAPDPVKVSDESTISNAVSSADVEAVKGSGISWLNSQSGSRGAITGVSEFRRKGQLCRSFDVSRESYDGVTLYGGEACQTSEGLWRMTKFAEN